MYGFKLNDYAHDTYFIWLNGKHSFVRLLFVSPNIYEHNGFVISFNITVTPKLRLIGLAKWRPSWRIL